MLGLISPKNHYQETPNIWHWAYATLYNLWKATIFITIRQKQDIFIYNYIIICIKIIQYLWFFYKNIPVICMCQYDCFWFKTLTLDKNNAYVTRTMLLHDCKWKIYKGVQVLWKL